MAAKTKKLSPRASISLQLMAQGAETIEERFDITRPLAMASGADRPRPAAKTLVPVIVEGKSAEDAIAGLKKIKARSIEHLVGPFVSAMVPVTEAEALLGSKGVVYVETVKEKHTLLDKALAEGRVTSSNQRTVPETGRDVVVGIVDSGFDLSHPAFRDGQGNLRVDALLDQTTNSEFTTAQLQAAWAGTNTQVAPGFDGNGHGTHVAAIASGSPFSGIEGVAPDARMVLVKTDFRRIANGVKWCFDKAGQRPCVVNLSLGSHFGGHDGTGREERTLDLLSGPGRIIVIAVGNAREDDIHIGGDFVPARNDVATFDILPNQQPVAVLTAWYDRNDAFDLEVISPSGKRLPAPAVGQSIVEDADGARVSIARNVGSSLSAVECQIVVEFEESFFNEDLRGWRLSVQCKAASIGRFDAWLAGERLARFRAGPMTQTSRTVGMPATAKRGIAVASHVTKNTWVSDLGNQSAPIAVVGRSSRFSSRGPTRDGRQKPEISAPGELITAALAKGSKLAGNNSRSHATSRTATIEGTSMAAPFVTGVVALMLQRRPQLTPEDTLAALKQSAVKDPHTGPADWTPEYGHGKVNAEAAVDATSATPHPLGPESSIATLERPRKRGAKRKKTKEVV